MPSPPPQTHPASAALAERLRVLLPPAVMRPAEPHQRAAVLILLYDRDGHPHTLLTKRTDTLTHHPGQISLPGGRCDREDPTVEATALREAFEELAITPGNVEIIGRLDDVSTIVSSFIVAPIIGVARGPIAPVPNPYEISRVIEVSIADVLAADETLGLEASGLELRYPLDGEDVWGATARILRLFVAALRTVPGAPDQPSMRSEGRAGSSA